MMKPSAKDYRMSAKAALSGNWGPSIGAYVLFALFLMIAGYTGVGSIILYGALIVGFSAIWLGLFRNGKIDFTDLFVGFKKDFINTLVFGLLYEIFITLWTMLFIIPGIVKSYSYSMAPYILADYPELSGNDAITASRKLMDGKKARLFCLDFSYIGWIILSLFTFGILLLWVYPWMYAARTDFYESIKDEVPALIGKAVEEPAGAAEEVASDENTDAE